MPILRHDMLKSEWEAVATLICYGTKVKYFPIRLPQPFVKTAILREESVTDAELLSSFMKVTSRDEKEIVERNLEQIDEEKVDLLDVLSTYQCYASPIQENIKELILQTAHKEIVQKPRYIAQSW